MYRSTSRTQMTRNWWRAHGSQMVRKWLQTKFTKQIHPIPKTALLRQRRWWKAEPTSPNGYKARTTSDTMKAKKVTQPTSTHGASMNRNRKPRQGPTSTPLKAQVDPGPEKSRTTGTKAKSKCQPQMDWPMWDARQNNKSRNHWKSKLQKQRSQRV